ncbi:DNA mismatch repair protein PMS1-like isoform X1 [Apium graveolens]|uniref:DNA mismatch repair protein PMS1-like isoform X1 n=1 Tax=Apium graveolens TaxID=4045 RepID=UPI003D7B1E49
MHMDTIRKNGFALEEDLYAPLGQRFKLRAVPFSKNITFGVVASSPWGHGSLLRQTPVNTDRTRPSILNYLSCSFADLKEMISILAYSQGECSMIGSYRMDTADSVCPPRVRSMLASRACRSSVTIGVSLFRIEMQKIIKHLADLKSPWNCPHGRPTMRHLVDLTTVDGRSDSEDEGL